jgi:hypothetical protein
MPEDMEDCFFEPDGKIWLRVGITENAASIPHIREVPVNVIEAEAEAGGGELSMLYGAEWEPEKPLPGLSDFLSFTVYDGRGEERAEESIVRASEYAGHRNRAVTVRDYERMALQAFPEIAKVKCLLESSKEGYGKDVVTLVVIPRPAAVGKENKRRPMVSFRLLAKMETYFSRRTTACIRKVNVINPSYEQALVRCHAYFKRGYSHSLCSSMLSAQIDSIIAPWLSEGALPKFDEPLDLSAVRERIMAEEYMERLEDFSIVVTTCSEGSYRDVEYHEADSTLIAPSSPHCIFFPSEEHLIMADENLDFGITDMDISGSFIVN